MVLKFVRKKLQTVQKLKKLAQTKSCFLFLRLKATEGGIQTQIIELCQMLFFWGRHNFLRFPQQVLKKITLADWS